MYTPTIAKLNTMKYVFLQKMTESNHGLKKMKRKVHRTKDEGICKNASRKVLQTRNTTILKNITNFISIF